MARRRPSDRIAQLIDAAIEVFTQKGYRRTQMADVARAAGVSQGTLYNYVESKEALFFLIIDRGLGDTPLPSEDELPIRTPTRKATIARVREGMNAVLQFPTLDRALASRAAADPRIELEAIIRELYAVMADTRRAADLIERSAMDLPEFGALIWIGFRRSIVDRLARYLRDRIARGLVRSLPDPSTAARLILENIVWFARHRHNSPDSAMISEQAALETTVDFLVNGLIAAPTPRTATGGHKEAGKLHAKRKLQ